MAIQRRYGASSVGAGIRNQSSRPRPAALRRSRLRAAHRSVGATFEPASPPAVAVEMLDLGQRGGVGGRLPMRKWLGEGGDLGRWVMRAPGGRSPARAARSPTARAVWPPTPASTSSKTSARVSPTPATVISASITRDSSPPEAVSRIGAAGTPELGASISSTRSAPVGPASSRGSSRTSKPAPSMASAASSSRTRWRASGRLRRCEQSARTVVTGASAGPARPGPIGATSALEALAIGKQRSACPGRPRRAHVLTLEEP